MKIVRLHVSDVLAALTHGAALDPRRVSRRVNFHSLAYVPSIPRHMSQQFTLSLRSLGLRPPPMRGFVNCGYDI